MKGYKKIKDTSEEVKYFPDITFKGKFFGKEGLVYYNFDKFDNVNKVTISIRTERYQDSKKLTSQVKEIIAKVYGTPLSDDVDVVEEGKLEIYNIEWLKGEVDVSVMSFLAQDTDDQDIIIVFEKK